MATKKNAEFRFITLIKTGENCFIIVMQNETIRKR